MNKGNKLVKKMARNRESKAATKTASTSVNLCSFPATIALEKCLAREKFFAQNRMTQTSRNSSTSLRAFPSIDWVEERCDMRSSQSIKIEDEDFSNGQTTLRKLTPPLPNNSEQKRLPRSKRVFTDLDQLVHNGDPVYAAINLDQIFGAIERRTLSPRTPLDEFLKTEDILQISFYGDAEDNLDFQVMLVA